MKIKYQISLFVIITLLVVTSTLATSYSLWVVSKEQTGENVISSGCFSVSYNDLDSNNTSTSINLNNTYPISDAVGIKQKPYKVTITNTCTIAAEYKLLFSDSADNTLDTKYMRYYLVKNNNTIVGPDYIDGLLPYTMEDSLKSDVEDRTDIDIKNSYVLASGVLNPQDTTTYEFRMWVRQDATDVMNKEFESVISIEAFATDTQS